MKPCVALGIGWAWLLCVDLTVIACDLVAVSAATAADLAAAIATAAALNEPGCESDTCLMLFACELGTAWLWCKWWAT